MAPEVDRPFRDGRTPPPSASVDAGAKARLGNKTSPAHKRSTGVPPPTPETKSSGSKGSKDKSSWNKEERRILLSRFKYQGSATLSLPQCLPQTGPHCMKK